MSWQADPVVASSGWQSDPVAVPAIDFNRPVAQVRADIAKLPEGQREQALRSWADAYVAKERAQGGFGQMVGDAIRTVSRGTFAGPFLDEANAATSAAFNAVGLGGAPYDEALAYQRAQDRAFDEANPAASVAGRLAGGVAGGLGALRAGPGVLSVATGGPLGAMPVAKTLPRQVVQGAGAGSLYGTVAGYGEGEGYEDRGNRAAQGGAAGAVLGGVLPPVVAGAGRVLSGVGEAVSPQVARFQAWRNQPTSNPGARVGMTAQALDDMPMSGGGATTAGADAAAEQVIANQLMRANVPASRLRQQLTEADDAALYYSNNSRAPNALALVDLDPSLQRLAGSVGRQQPEAANTMQAFQYARQTGQTPQQPLSPSAGLPTRPALARPQPGDSPMGQVERVRDGLERVLLIRDKDFHGHAANAYRTDQALIASAKRDAQPLYRASFDAARDVDLTPELTPVLQKWAGQLIDEPEPVARALTRAMRLTQRALSPGGQKSHLERVDKVKQWLDDQIGIALKSANGRQRYLGGKLTEFKNEMLGVLDNISTNGIGGKYAAARRAYSDPMEARRRLEIGRKAWDEDSDVAADMFERYRGDDGNIDKLVRLGLLSGYERAASRMKRTADVTQLFDSPRVQEILQAVIPRTDKAGAVFANRPERFGRYVGNEKAMIQTRNEVFGNSKTAQRLADDQSFETLSTVVEQFRTSPSLINIGLKAMETMLNRMFGMRADTAASISRMLFTADPAERARVLAAIEARMGPTRAAQLADMMQAYQRQVTQAGAITGAGTLQE